MFSYVDKNIRKKFEQSDRLVNLDQEGRVIRPDNTNTPYISMLGPIPLPRELDGRE